MADPYLEKMRLSWQPVLPPVISSPHISPAASASSRGVCISPENPRESGKGFTLMELLVVVAIMMTLMVVAIPAFNAITATKGVGAAAQEISGALEIARVHAMSNNTYTWVGIFEEDATDTPGTAGIGRIVLCMVASRTGAIPYDVRNPAAIPATSLTQLGKLTRIEKVHLTALPAGTGSGDKLESRPSYTSSAATITDTLPVESKTPFQVKMGDTQYTFTKAVQFSPSGEARINNNASGLMPISEIGLTPARGSTPLLNNPDKVAIQFTGTAGNVKIYRP